MTTPNGRNPEGIRRYNLGLILRAIHRAPGISRHRLAVLTNLTKATISDVVNVLEEIGLVRVSGEGESSARGGRKPVMLETIPNSAVAIGVDIRRELVSAVMVDLQARMLAKETNLVKRGDEKATILMSIESCVRAVLKKKPKHVRLLGIGVGAPGPLDASLGRVFEPPDFGTFRNVDLTEWISERLQTKVILSLGAAAGAMGEYCSRRDLSEPCDDIAFVEIDLGIGLGFVVNGRVIYGNGRKAAGEIGHTVIEVDGKECSCGRKGCLYRYGSGMAVLDEVMEGQVLKQRESPANLRQNGEKLIEAVYEARNGNKEYDKAFRRAARYLGIGLMNVDSLLSPSLVVIGSSIDGLADLYLHHVRESLQDFEVDDGSLRQRLRLSKYGENSISMGAAHTVLESFFSDPKKTLEILQDVAFR